MNKLLSAHGTATEPHQNERPTEFAERIGRWYASMGSAEHKKRFGQYFTTIQVMDGCSSGKMLIYLSPQAMAQAIFL
jgi:hypothetical protein